MKHIGQLVEAAVRQSGIPISKLSKKLGKSRQTIYRLFAAPTIDWDMVVEIGRIINHDFAIDFKNTLPINVVNEPPSLTSYTSNRNLLEKLDQCQEDVNYWKGKYIELLERVNKV